MITKNTSNAKIASSTATRANVAAAPLVAFTPSVVAKEGFVDTSETGVFSNAFYDFEAPERKKAQPGGEAASPPACAIGAFIGLHGQTCH
jgi:hypothetical protein